MPTKGKSIAIIGRDPCYDSPTIAGRYGHCDATMILTAYRHGLKIAELRLIKAGRGSGKAHDIPHILVWDEASQQFKQLTGKSTLPGYSGDGGQAFHLKADSDSGRSRTAFR